MVVSLWPTYRRVGFLYLALLVLFRPTLAPGPRSAVAEPPQSQYLLVSGEPGLRFEGVINCRVSVSGQTPAKFSVKDGPTDFAFKREETIGHLKVALYRGDRLLVEERTSVFNPMAVASWDGL